VVPHGEPPRLGTLSRFLRQRGLAAYKVPDRLEIVAALPQTAMGKVDKAALRERAASLVGAQPGAAQPTGAAG
jgi:2,3-dihydroxybenzoate-AMP ligase